MLRFVFGGIATCMACCMSLPAEVASDKGSEIRGGAYCNALSVQPQGNCGGQGACSQITYNSMFYAAGETENTIHIHYDAGWCSNRHCTGVGSYELSPYNPCTHAATPPGGPVYETIPKLD